MTVDAAGRPDAQAAIRTEWKWSLGLTLLWVVLAVNYWMDDDGDPVLPWLFTVLAVGQLTRAAVLWRRVRDAPPS